uniref:RRM domain-containing protein n=1 Tax=Panagrellus redivivus TaxID=6233 RepID=A0A7E4VZV9_PANRE
MAIEDDNIKVLQVYNISTAAKDDVIKQLFQYFGRVTEIQVYPVVPTITTTQKVAYVRYEREKSVALAQHLTNTVFYDRALVCAPNSSNTIPDEETALQSSAVLGKRVLPAGVQNHIKENEHGQMQLYTVDPTLTNLGLPPYPPLGPDLDPERVEEIRRTVYVGGLKKDVNPEDVIKFFNTIGEVMFLRMANVTEHHDCAYAYIEFTAQQSVPQALQNDGVEFQGQPVRIQHSRVAIVKPQQKTNDQALEEVEEAMRRRDGGKGSSPARRTRSPSLVRRRSRSPRRRRSRSPCRDRDRGSRRDRKKDDDRDRSSRRDRERERERDRKDRSDRSDRDRSDRKDRDTKDRSDRDKKDRSDRDKDRSDRDKDRSDRDKKDRVDRDRSDRSKDRSDRDKDKKKESSRRRSRSPRKDERKERRRSVSRSPERKRRREDEKDRKRDKDRALF